ncbi:putative amino-acid ABC transporter permease protein, partial [Lacticaseibacillus paracasei subsp. paracasei Lpp189]
MWKIVADAVPQMAAAGIKYTIPIALVHSRLASSLH